MWNTAKKESQMGVKLMREVSVLCYRLHSRKRQSSKRRFPHVCVTVLCLLSVWFQPTEPQKEKAPLCFIQAIQWEECLALSEVKQAASCCLLQLYWGAELEKKVLWFSLWALVEVLITFPGLAVHKTHSAVLFYPSMRLFPHPPKDSPSMIYHYTSI